MPHPLIQTATLCSGIRIFSYISFVDNSEHLEKEKFWIILVELKIGENQVPVSNDNHNFGDIEDGEECDWDSD